MPHKKVWECQLFSSLRNMQDIDMQFPKNDLETRVDFQRRYKNGHGSKISMAEYPDYIFFNLRDLSKKKNSLPDVFRGRGGLAFVSSALNDLMQQFNLGDTRFNEVPLYEYDQETRRPGQWYLLHIREDRRTLVPEESTALEHTGVAGRWRPDSSGDHKLALDPSPVGELDMWRDRSLQDGVFISDRLKTAIKSSELKTRWLGFRPCKIVEAGL
mgnify:CR=1 FL=1